MYESRLDMGTPMPLKIGMPVTLTVDGRPVTVTAGASVMRAAAEAGIKVPKLCATDSLDAFGSCRVCLVEIEGRKGYPASCTTEVEDGMVVHTQSRELDELRSNVVELYVSDHPLECDTCSANGDCELQDVAASLGVESSRYGMNGAGHQQAARDDSNPYFAFDPSQCIVCYRCVRACDDIQGTFALTVDGRGFASKIVAGQAQSFMDSDCVSCGACVDHCPTEALIEKPVMQKGQPDRSITTTCAYCGVGCSFHAELKDGEVLRMVPDQQGQANEGHACIKGRFAFGYATHKDRITRPMIRENINDPWREVSWEEAFSYTAERFRAIQQEYGPDSIGGITSSRCTNEETYLVQKMVRAAFGNNNVDTCARVCHSPTGYGLKTTLGESAGTQAFNSVASADLVMVMGANPSDAHPVFASRLKRRLREGAQLIVADPRRIELVSSAHIKADHHLALRPGSNVAFINAMAHVVVTEGLEDAAFIEARCESGPYQKWREFISGEQNSPETTERITGIPASELRAAARLFATAPNAAIYYGLGVSEHSQGSTTVMGIANLAMATGNLGREGVGVNPLRGQNNVQGSCDMGSFPHELPGYRHISDASVRSLFEQEWNTQLRPEPGLRIPNMFDASISGNFKGLYVQGEDVAQSDPNTHHVEKALQSLECLVVQDIFLNETARFAHVLLPGSSFLEKNGTFTNAERRISMVRKAIEPLAGLEDWEVTMALSNALGYPMNYGHPSEIMDEIARLTPTFQGVSYAKLDRLGSIQWPCNDEAPEGTPTMHVDEFVRGKGYFAITGFVPTDERATRKYPLLMTTGRILSQYNVGAQTRRTANSEFYAEDILEIHPFDAEERGISEGDWCGIVSRAGETVLRAVLTDRVQPGVVYTTFHFPSSGANVITTDNSDWATNCPEYKVTAVQVSHVSEPSEWQKEYRDFARRQEELLEKARV
ncbi:MAG: formate dehydrogenase subunit alpha [Xanthomonadales bacterium]|jgi:formate dehydrogenase major subunit|nr:formate dehydrogenase subunit alpha [Xanthomonadales bacterium]MDH4000939.1 formate dehydrogenase subunit alpha [Xanthomonadales bacterium]